MSVVLVVVVFVVVVFVVVEVGGVGVVTAGVLDVVVVWPVLVPVPVLVESHELVGVELMLDAGAHEFDEALVASLGVVVVVVELLPPPPVPLHEFVAI